MIKGIILSGDSDFAAEYNAVDTYETYGLALAFDDFAVSAPQVRTDYKTIRGMDGVLDVSEAPQGFPVFEDRTIKWKMFKGPRPFMDWDIQELLALRTQFMARWQGQRIRMIFPDDPDHYWVGRLSVGALEAGNGLFECEARVYPYKLKNVNTEVTLADLSTAYKTYTLTNERRFVVPEITYTQEMYLQVLSGPVTVPPEVHLTLASGQLSNTVKLPDTLLMNGSISVKAKLAASAQDPYCLISYREGTF